MSTVPDEDIEDARIAALVAGELGSGLKRSILLSRDIADDSHCCAGIALFFAVFEKEWIEAHGNTNTMKALAAAREQLHAAEEGEDENKQMLRAANAAFRALWEDVAETTDEKEAGG